MGLTTDIDNEQKGNIGELISLQMLEMIKQKAFQLALNKQDMASQKIHHIFAMEYNICTDKLPAVATVQFL